MGSIKLSTISIVENKEFNYIYNKAYRKHSFSFVLFFIGASNNRLFENNMSRVAFVASKKVGNAVKRNRARRRLKALYIQNRHKLKLGSYIFVAKNEIHDKTFMELQNEFKYCCKKLNAFIK